MRTIIPFNSNWLFCPEQVVGTTPDSAFERISLPHTNKIFPHHNFDNTEYQFVSTYRKRFTLPEPRNGRRVYIDFDGAMISSTVYLNGRRLGEHDGGFTPFSFDLTDYLQDDGENLLTVHLDSTERPDIPPFGFVVDYLTFGGIYRDVKLRYVAPCYIEDVFVRTKNTLAKNPLIETHATIVNSTGLPQQITLHITVDYTNARSDDPFTYGSVELTIPPRSEFTHVISLDTHGRRLQLWSLDNPELFLLTPSLFNSDKEELDSLVDVRFGFREIGFRKDGFYLNGEKIKLIGLNRHQTYPYIGAAAPVRLQRKDADIIKYELGCNIVRTSHYPQSSHFLDRCDEIGLLVFEEIPGWQHIGDNDWQALVQSDVEAMIVRDRNRPSIVLWGVRINESQDNESLYTQTNTLAHKLDPTRQTGGVRYFQDSQFLEDVFTFNDFSNTVQEPKQTPHLVTEFNGHMFPTKMWDSEERLIEHALRHARIQDKQMGMSEVCGAIGWCAFDYNTHKEFGSGDRICYHGVMDIFRLPKFAAYFYESQISPKQRVVLHPATLWSMGDRSEGGNDPLLIFSNCEEVEVFLGDTSFGKIKPDRKNFPNLAYPPFEVTGLKQWLTWGQWFTDLRIVGYIDGKQVAEQRFASDGLPAKLTLEPDDAELNADGMDMTRLVFKIVDKYGNRLPYTNQVVSFEVEGEADLLGENPFALMGGQAALYLRARHTPGVIHIRATTPRLEPATATVTIT